MKTIIIYFSAEGTTKRIAQTAGKLLKAPLFEIKAEKPYTKADLNWMNPLARVNREHLAKKKVESAGRMEDFSDYDTVLLGFPIWYGTAPNIVNTFCENYDWTNKKVYLFATSGGSGMGRTKEKLLPYIKGAEVVSEKLVSGRYELENWLSEVNLI